MLSTVLRKNVEKSHLWLLQNMLTTIAIGGRVDLKWCNTLCFKLILRGGLSKKPYNIFNCLEKVLQNA